MARAHAAAEAEAGETREHGEDAIAGMAKDHGGSESDFTRCGSLGGVECTFPGEDDVDGEGIVDAGGGGEIRAGLVPGGSEGVTVERGGAGVEPSGWRFGAGGDRVADGAGGVDAGLEDEFTIGGSSAAIDGTSAEVDESGSAFEFAAPRAGGFSIPGDFCGCGVVG